MNPQMTPTGVSSHFLAKAHEARAGGYDAWRVMSTGEKVCVALALNRADWLADMGYTIPEALDRAGSWLRQVPQVAREVVDDAEREVQP